MIIKTSDLRKVCESLLSHLEELKIDNINIDKDYYWVVENKDKYSSDSPQNFTLGQLTDDWQDLQKMLNGEFDPTIHNFLDLAPILIRIGELGEAALLKNHIQ